MQKEILKEILRRHYKFGKVFLSRTETQRFGMSEWALRKAIRELRRQGLHLVGKQYCGEPKFANVYVLSQQLRQYIREQFGKKRMSFDVFAFNKNCSLDTVKNLLGLSGYKNNYVVSKDKDFKITYNKEYNIITRWNKNDNTSEHFNLFNGLKMIFGLSTYNLIKELG